MDVPEMEEVLGVEILRGHSSHCLQPQSNVVRVFISSTCSDMESERHAFWDKAYPELQGFCQSLGLVFEVVDFRWDVCNSVVSDHITTELNLREIQICQKVSVGPSFIALIGSQYGHRPLPRLVPEEEFELLLSKLSEDQEGLACLKQWFIKDLNSVPPNYVLQPITTHFPHYNDKRPNAGPEHDSDILSWNLMEARLLKLLQAAATQAEKDGDINAEQKNNYFKSMTERELEQGFFHDQVDNTLASIFIRELPSLKKSDRQKHTYKFLDITADGLLDTEAQELLTNLKHRIHSACSSDHVLRCVELSKSAIDVNRKEHKEYLESFCEQIVSQIKGKISRPAPLPMSLLCLQQELIHHAKLSNNKCAVFRGRDSLLGKLCLTMWESTNTQHAPLVVCGPPGVGKTALLCKLAQEMRAVLEPQAVVALRLLGTSPLSSDVNSVLKGLCIQVCGAFQLAPASPETANTHEKLVRFFHALLHKVSAQGESLLIILDSLDSLSQVGNTHKLHWLPKEIPPNVHLVVSTLHQGSPLEVLRAQISHDNFFFQVDPLTFDEGRDIVKSYMSAARRQLTSEQENAILESFNKSGIPLHLKLLLDKAKHWSSYTTMMDICLGNSVQEEISLFLQALEVKHGKQLVSHALGYISLSRHGLSEAELRDVLSLDNDVLNEVYQSRLPQNHMLIRFPPVHWAQLRHDLGDHLVERWENGIVVLEFTLRPFAQAVKERYLFRQKRVQMHSILSEYFSGQWSKGESKHIFLTSLKTQLQADRKVPFQPLWVAEGVANLRKLHELPYHFIYADKWEDLRNSVLGSLDWLYCKTLSCGVASVIKDLSLSADVMDCPEVQLIRDCFVLLKPTLDFIDGHIDPLLLCTEISTRLQALAHLYPSLIGLLCSQCQDQFASCTDPVLVPRCNFFPAPGGPLKNTLSGFTKGVTAVHLCSERGLLIAGSENGVLIVWDLNHLEVLHAIVGHTGAIQSVKLLDGGNYCLSTGLDGCLKKWSLHSGKELYCIKTTLLDHSCPIEQIHVIESSTVILFNKQGQIKAWCLNTGELLYEIDENRECLFFGVLGEEVAVMSTNGQFWLHDSHTGLQKSEIQLSFTQAFNVVSVLPLTKHGKLLISSQECSLILVSGKGKLADVELPAPASFMCISDDEKIVFAAKNSPKALCKDVNLQLHLNHVTAAILHQYSCRKLAGCERTLAVLHLSPNSVEKSQDFQHESIILSAIFYNQGHKVITGCQDQIIRVWGLTTGQLLDSLSGMGSPVTFLSVYNTTIISSSTSSTCIKLWQLDYDPRHKSQACIPANCPKVVISRDGNTVYFVKEGDKTKVFTWSCVEGLSSDSMDVSSEVCCMELAQQKQLLFCGLRTGTILIYPLAFAQETLCLPPPESLPAVRSMAISPREDRIAVAYEDVVCLFEITARDSFPCVEGPFETYSLSLLHSPVSAMALLSDCRLLYGTLGGEVAIYDFKSASAAELDHHGAAITCVALSNWDTHALVGSQDCVQKLWSLSPLLLDHAMEYKGFYFEGVQCAVFSVNDKYVFTGSRDKTVKVWDVATGSLLYIQYIYSSIIKMIPYKDGFVAVSQLGSFIKEGFSCPNTLSPGYNPLRNFRAHYRVTSREKRIEPPHSFLKGVPEYNPAQFNFMSMLKTKQSNTCVLL